MLFIVHLLSEVAVFVSSTTTIKTTSAVTQVVIGGCGRLDGDIDGLASWSVCNAEW